MPKFFVSPSEIGEEIIVLRGDDAAHIAKTLRMRKGETLTICDGAGNDYLCCILSANPALVEVKIEEFIIGADLRLVRLLRQDPLDRGHDARCAEVAQNA